jgi:DNA primase
MRGRIADDAIRDIRDRTNLVELISDKTSLRSRGRNYVGLCPFHAENTPSFTVSVERGFFHCFGCGASGDAFAWVMRTEQMTFPEAVRRLGARAGVELPAEPGERRDRRADELLCSVNEEAASFFQRALWDEAAGAAARTYLGKRGIGDALARRYKLGYAPASGDALARSLRSRSIPLEAALTVGVVGRRSDGSTFDRFRARLMFPIVDGRGRLCGFGGRVLPGAPSDVPKYLNSPESPLFKKGQLLYGLPEARDAIRESDRAVVVEGYLDVLSLVQSGIGVAVAPLGTALTADQLRYLRRYTGNIVACFDGDEAGARAAVRSFPVFVEAGVWGRAAFLPAGDDPDSFVRTQGAAAFEGVVAQATPLLDVFLRSLVDPGEPSVGRRVQAAQEVGRLLRRVHNSWEYDVLARRAAERLGVGEELLREQGSRAAPSGGAGHARARPQAAGETLLIELMLTGGDAVERVAREGGVSLFEEPAWRTLTETILEQAHTGADPSALLDRVPPEMRERAATALLGEQETTGNRAQLIDDCLAFIRRRQERRRMRQVLEEIRAAEAAGDEERVREGLRQWRALVAPGATGAPVSGGQS